MASIDEMNSKMTLFYNKRTGEIKTFCTGIQNMNYFGEDAEDYSLIWDFVVLPFDNTVLNNWRNFKVNTENKQLEMKAEFIPQYPIATQ